MMWKMKELRCLQAALVLPASECATRSSNRLKTLPACDRRSVETADLSNEPIRSWDRGYDKT